MQQIKKLELWVGAFMLAGFAAILMLIFKVADVQSLGNGESYTLKAQFDNIGGLKVRSPIKVGGVTVGKVTAITLDTDTYVPVVTLSIEKRFGYFPETSSAAILTSGLLGEQYLGIEPGFVEEGIEMLTDGALIQDTKSALVLEDMIGQVLYSIGGENK
ncbi:outer membrane lipid asymmetry maintenance protein MlaD [Photobacterium sp. TY1-4]|uniref:outer membrane lipid asymmetry maintenance protein MlaD n=1 Tax=Photobacterium sp. TY1-4 TaxID=2899122 RepID=UPI0021BFEADD|nr:outer membrane lipid asymmetry maintenance protein MlaD [Photobacterium sp. TY1-4]UXI01620.1 outer membrane lipid asymmetry maintenance protein MlaD [Photobacterium sp. TY1-4]